MALLTDDFPLPEMEYSLADWSTAPHEVEFKRLLDESANLPEGEIVGYLCRWQRGDGYAYYRVTAERPLTLQLVPYGDAWTVEDALIRGLTVEDVRDRQRRDIRFRALFGGGK